MTIIINLNKFLRRNPDIKRINGMYFCKGSPYRVFLRDKLSIDLCRFIGIMQGDGNLSSNRIHITDEDPEYHTKVLYPLVKKLFNLELNLYYDNPRGSYYSHIKSSVIYRYIIQCLGFSAGSVRDSILNKIPSYLYQLDLCQKSYYIAGLYDAEGHVKLRQAEIDFSITSIPVGEYISEFFDYNAIDYTPIIRKREGRSLIYEIYIYGRDDVSLFSDLIPILHPAKVNRIRKLLHH